MELRDAPVRIHPTAVVEQGAQLGADVEVGPYAVIEAGATIGHGCRIGPHVHLLDACDIAEGCQIRSGAVLGGRPQIRDHRGPGGRLRIGARTVIGEHGTAHRASHDGQATLLGCDVFLMGGAHVAHDCRIGDGVTIANGTLLAGYVEVQARAFISGNVVVHQFARIGELSMVGGRAAIGRDVPPFMLAAERSLIYGINSTGLRRAGIPPERRRALTVAHHVLYRSGLNLSQAIDRLARGPITPEVERLLAFISSSTRGLCGPAPRRRARPPAG